MTTRSREDAAAPPFARVHFRFDRTNGRFRPCAEGAATLVTTVDALGRPVIRQHGVVLGRGPQVAGYRLAYPTSMDPDPDEVRAWLDKARRRRPRR